EFGSASKATSDTPRWVPDHLVCQLGLGSNVLSLPPELDHTVSPLHASLLVFAPRVVPAAAITYCEAAGQLGAVPTVGGHSSAPESPVAIEKVWPCATATAKIASCAAAEPSACASVSHSPSEALMIF